MATQLDKEGNWHSTKVFPCECGTEGLMVIIEEDRDMFDVVGAPFIGISFWEMRAKLEDRAGLTRWERIKYAWHILRGRSPWTDMVWMRSATAKNLANHILYLINKVRKSSDSSKPLVDWPEKEVVEEDVKGSYFCVQHGGSPVCEELNKTRGFDCPRCEEEKSDKN